MDIETLQRDRVAIGELNSAHEGKKVTIAGWLYDSRELGKIRFLVIRDVTGDLQIVGVKGETNSVLFETMGKISRESVVVISGIIKKSAKAPGRRELVPETLDVLAVAEHPLPIDVSDFSKTELPKRLDYRFLDFHRRRTQSIFRIQSTIAQAFLEYFANQGYVILQAPCLISAASEGGADLFKVKYFEKEACLAQSPQLYKQMLACSMEKVTMISTVWRAEKHNTIRHINEIRQMDIEVAFHNQMSIMNLEEGVIRYMIQCILKKNASDLALLGVALKIPQAHYISYTDAITFLIQEGVKISYGEDLSPEAEKKLGEIYPDDLVFVHSWPLSLRAFYIMPRGENPTAELSEGFDLIYKGLEITSGGQRIHLPELLIQRIQSKGLKVKDFKEYIDSFRFGAPPHAGWSIGLERFTMLITGQENIREATMFPRDRDRLTP